VGFTTVGLHDRGPRAGFREVCPSQGLRFYLLLPVLDFAVSILVWIQGCEWDTDILEGMNLAGAHYAARAPDAGSAAHELLDASQERGLDAAGTRQTSHRNLGPLIPKGACLVDLQIIW
jgi:hypothetical protein